MTMEEIISQISFMLGLPANKTIENIDLEQGVLIAFRELKRYMRNSVDKTVPYAQRIELAKVGIDAIVIKSVKRAKPKLGLTMGSIESGNVFEVAAAVGTQGNVSSPNLQPIVSEMALSQVRNSLSTDLQWRGDKFNGVIYITCRSPRPSAITITYVPNLQTVSEILSPKWQDYLIRMATANIKIALGRSRTKYTIEGSNVSLDGELLLTEGNAELEQIREELESSRNKFKVLN